MPYMDGMADVWFARRGIFFEDSPPPSFRSMAFAETRRRANHSPVATVPAAKTVALFFTRKKAKFLQTIFMKTREFSDKKVLKKKWWVRVF